MFAQYLFGGAEGSRTPRFQSTPPRGGRLRVSKQLHTHFSISIHAPREGGDAAEILLGKIAYAFQSTPPARGATLCRGDAQHRAEISIHAPREGGDRTTLEL